MQKRTTPSRMTLLAAGLAVLLLVLAILQYRWLGQVSDAEREQLRASLNRRGQEFAAELNRELARAFASFQAPPVTPGSDDQDVSARLASAWSEWTRAAQYPKLIRDVYAVEAPDAGSPGRLSHFDPQTGRMEPAAWTAALEPLRVQFAHETEGDEREGGRVTIVRRHPPLAEEVPALVIPAVRLRSIDQQNQRLMFQGTVTLAYTIVLLDVEYARNELLPALTERHFNPPDARADFLVTVIKARAPQDIIFQSEPVRVSPDRVDLRQPLLEIRADEMGRVMVEQANRSGPSTNTTRTTQLRFAVGIQQRQSSPVSAWQLLVTHRAGSVDAAIGAARRRNLTISFGILLLFGTSIGLLVASTMRARRLADRQMEFVAAVSHELRTPLAVIRSAGENLADGVVSDSAQVEKYGRLIEEQGRSLSNMVEQVLAFAGAENGDNGGRIAARHPVDVGELLDGVIEAARQLTGNTVTFERSIAAGLPSIEGHPDALRRVFQNLVDNAVKYGGGGGWVGISAFVRGRELVVSVADRGLGIETADQRHIFEPFYRGRQATAAQIHGSGLGLSLVQRIVHAHGGRVAVKSTAGQGSTFSVFLPIPTSEPAACPEFSSSKTNPASS